jgi:hypothetical protein
VWLAAGIVDGIHSEVDMVQLDDSQSLLALIAGLQLFSMTRTGLVHLDRYRLEDPRFSGRLPEHRCNIRWESNIPGAGPVTPTSRTETPPY